MKYSPTKLTDPFKIGTRGSLLTLAQVYENHGRLCAALDLFPNAFGAQIISTAGDCIIERRLQEIGGKGLFTRETKEAMLAGEIDTTVHSMKDMPTLKPDGLLLDTYLPREDMRGAFVSLNVPSLADLAEASVVGTSSLGGEVLRSGGLDAIDDDMIVKGWAQAGEAMTAHLLERAGEGFFDWRQV